ncbi:Wings apart-like protein [Penicillium expansum]|uniref:Wings apart-like protein n=1 Tax=Penicillium expansum TaxID=27334 RepID=A0A0A2IBX9_PENEN|nr:Wings apart-like protein [Penicillium expansum]KGO39916.1 Wings apart-like protein [Penicillium expansum]KGO53320.1 Wings apart-like protein [Penicillium expansum]KGO61383.1 Wings apart-like protein [Penicillium expansum]
MDNSQPRNRRLVTYGSATKSQPPLNIDKPVRSPAARTTPKEMPLPSSSRLSRPFYTRLRRDKNEDEQPSGSEETTTNRGLAQPKPIAESNVYDFPSSGDEQMSMVQRKRRRYSPNGNKSVPATKRSVKPSETENGDRKVSPPMRKRVPVPDRNKVVSATRRSVKPSETESGDRDVSSQTGKRALNGRGSLAKQPEVIQQPSPVRSAPYSRAGRSVRSQTKVSTLENEMGVSTEESPGDAESVRKSSPDISQGYATKANITPGRRRLIDSLGITEHPVETSPAFETSPESPAGSQPSPNPIPPDRASPSAAVNECPTESYVQGSPASVPSNLRGSRVTYARQRSFLDDLIMSEDLSAHDASSGPKHRSQSVQRQLNYEATSTARLIVPNEDTNEDGSVRSIHELRQAGGNARYRGAVESIFEDIEDPQNSLSGRCNAFLQLCGKLLDTGLKRRFVECNFDKRLVDCLSMDLQVVPTILAFCAYALGSSDGHMSYVLATSAWPKLLEASPALLGMQDDITVVARAQTSGLSRPLQKTLQNTTPQIAAMLFPDPASSRLSPCTLALYCLKSTISTMQTKGENPSLSTSLLKQLVQVLVSESQRCVSLEKIHPESSQILCMGFSILEASTALAESLTKEDWDILDPLSGLHSLLCSESGTISQIQPLYIRLILNITNSNPSLCDRFATPEMVGGLVHIVSANFGDLTEDALGQANNSLDSVILALGALINLTEQSGASRSIFLHSAGTSKPLLDQLLHLFITHVDSISTAHSVLEVHHNVAVGYLAVLLLTLSLDLETRSKIKSSLAPNGLTAVISTVDEFLQYHQKIEQEISTFPTQGQPASGFLSRLQELITRIRLAEQ